MSNSTTKPTRRRDQPGWFALSIVLHLIAIAALIFLTPLREVLLEETSTVQASSEPQMSTRQLSEVNDQLEEMTEKHIERNVQAMHELLRQMQQVNDEEFKDFVVFEHAQIERTPEVVEDSLERALAAMKEAQDALAKNDYAKAVTQQALVASHQETIQQRLDLVQASPEVRQAQQQAATIQEQAAEQTLLAKDAEQQRQAIERRLKFPEQQKTTLEARVPKSQETLEAAQKRLVETQTKLSELRQTLDRAKAMQDAKAIERSSKRVKSAEDAVQRAERSVESKKTEKAKLGTRLETFQAQVADLQKTREEQKLAADAHKASVEKQTEAIRLQSEAAKKLEREVAERVAELQARLAPEQTVQTELSRANEVPPTEQKNTLELYEAARAAEQKLAEKYRQGRALRLSMLQDVPFSAALKAIDRVVPVRPDLPAKALSADVRNQAQLEQKKQAVRTALAETCSMVALGNTLVSQAIAARTDEVGTGSGAGKLSLAAIQARSAQMQRLATLANQESSGQAVDLAKAMQGEGGNLRTTDEPIQAPTIDKSILPVAGRKVSDDGEAATWMAVTQWHLLGPFANPGRANIDRVFPPESLVDLNAVYIGKGDWPIRWTFTQSNHERGRVRPANEEPYGIWYAYTELHFDRPRDLWIAMGSDDKGQVWINEHPVWMSANFHKNWSTNEALRRVHFKKGRNRILYRIENGQHGMGFSLWVHLADGVGKATP